MYIYQSVRYIGTTMWLSIFLLFAAAYIECSCDVTDTKDLEDKFKTLADKFKALHMQMSPLNQYCRLLKNDICGKCTCVDDYRLPEKYYCDCQNLEPQRDCLDFYKHGYKVSGIYKVTQMGIKTVQVYCDQTTDGGGWTVIQRRMDGSEIFRRDWASYKRGFGSFQHEHWLGNRQIHTLTLQALFHGGSELRVDVMGWNYVEKYAKYSNFQVGNEFTKYKLHVGGYTGNAGDSFSAHDGVKFTTIDQDNDIWSSNVAKVYGHGGWWYKNYHLNSCNLNGHYYRIGESIPSYKGMFWKTLPKGGKPLKRAEMKIRRKV